MITSKIGTPKTPPNTPRLIGKPDPKTRLPRMDNLPESAKKIGDHVFIGQILDSKKFVKIEKIDLKKMIAEVERSSSPPLMVMDDEWREANRRGRLKDEK